MATVISEGEAQADIGRLIDRALGGEDIVIARNDEVVLSLVPIGKRSRVPGKFKGQFSLPDSFFDPMTEEELKEWGY